MANIGTIPQQKKSPQNRAILEDQQTHSPADSSFGVDEWVCLERFLTFGSGDGRYYVKEKPLTAEEARSVPRCIALDGERTVRMIATLSRSGLAPTNSPAIFSLALAVSLGDERTRRAALDVLPDICRIGDDLFRFADSVDGMRGWGRGLRAAIAKWYSARSVKEVAFQAVRYGRRDGWSHRDLLRLAHPKPDGDARRILYHWITQGWERIGDAPHDQKDLQIIWAMEKAKLPGTTAKTVAELIRDYGLPREAVPIALLGERIVWEALLEQMPLESVLDNLAVLTWTGVLESRVCQNYVAARLTDRNRLAATGIHPIAFLSALKSYALGRSERGRHRWNPANRIIEALEAAFYLSFGNVVGTGKRCVVSLFLPGGPDRAWMSGTPGLFPRDASVAMAMVSAASEDRAPVLTLRPNVSRLTLSPGERLDDVVTRAGTSPVDEVDCAGPILWALENGVEADAFIVYCGGVARQGGADPARALRLYRSKTGIAARLVVVGMAADTPNIADPTDAGMLDIIGFDKKTPRVIAQFVGG